MELQAARGSGHMETNVRLAVSLGLVRELQICGREVSQSHDIRCEHKKYLAVMLSETTNEYFVPFWMM